MDKNLILVGILGLGLQLMECGACGLKRSVFLGVGALHINKEE